MRWCGWWSWPRSLAVLLGPHALSGATSTRSAATKKRRGLAGVNVGRVKTLVYMISGACAAIVGLLLMARFSSGSPQTGTGYELQAIAAAVVGGTSLMGGRGTVVGTFLGALLIGLLYNAMDLLHIESYTQLIVLGAVILFAVIADELRKRYLSR